MATRGSTKLPSEVELRLPASEEEVLIASRAIARDLDLTVRQQPGGGLLAHARFPFFALGAVAIGIAADGGGTAVSIRQARLGATTGAQNYYLRELIHCFEVRLGSAFGETDVAGRAAAGAHELHRHARTAVLMSVIRVSQSIASMAGLALFIGGLFVAGRVGMILAIAGLGLGLPVSSALEAVKRRRLGAGSTTDIYMFAGSVLLAAVFAVIVALLLPGT
jgi:hypothetical protein